MARKLIVEIVGDASKLDRSFKDAQKSTTGFATSIGKIGVGFGTLVKGTLIVGGVQKAMQGLGSAIGASVEEWQQQTQVAAQTGAVIKSTGGIAGVTADHVDKLASQLSSLSGMDDEAIQSGENLLLTFTNLRNVAGKGNDVFDQATKVMADVSVAMGTDTKTAAIQLGKALNDPVRGVGQLRRIGVSFTKAQRDQIKALVDSGKTLEAQKLILGELRKEFGGSAKAAGDTMVGQLNKLRETFRNVGGSIVGALAPGLTAGLNALNDFVQKLAGARTLKAKLNVVWEGIKDAGAALYGLLRRGVEAAWEKLSQVDWSSVARGAGDRVKAALAAIGEALRSINWAAVIQQAAQGLSAAIVKLLDFRTTILQKVDWQNVGKYIVDGLVIAVAAVAKFVASIDWGRVVRALVRTLIATIRAEQNLFLGIGKEIVALLGKGINAGFDALKRWLTPVVLKIALDLVEPFSHLPSKAGKWARDLKDEWNAQLDQMAKDSRTGGEAITSALGEGINAGMDDAKQAAVAARQAAADAAAKATPKPRVPHPGDADRPDAGGGTTTTKQKRMTADQRRQRANSWFDARIARQLDRLQDLGLKRQLAGLRVVAQEIRARMAITHDLTRRLNLQDKLVSVLRDEKSVQGQITDQVKAQNQALKDRADQIKSALLDQLDRKQQARTNKQALTDAVAALKLAKQIGGPQGIKLAQRDVATARFAIRRARLEALPASLVATGAGGQRFSLGNSIVINIHGTDDPEAVARKVVAIIQRHGRHSTTQQRGPTSGGVGAGGYRGPH